MLPIGDNYCGEDITRSFCSSIGIPWGGRGHINPTISPQTHTNTRSIMHQEPWPRAPENIVVATQISVRVGLCALFVGKRYHSREPEVPPPGIPVPPGVMDSYMLNMGRAAKTNQGRHANSPYLTRRVQRTLGGEVVQQFLAVALWVSVMHTGQCEELSG